MNCDLRLLDFETFGGFGYGVRKILRQAADQLSNKLSHAQHLDEVTWTTKNWHGLQMQRLSVVLHTAVAWQTVNELRISLYAHADHACVGTWLAG